MRRANPAAVVAWCGWTGVLVLAVAGGAPAGSRALQAAGDAHPPIPVRFSLKKPGYVTLVIDDAGVRVRNLVSEMPFPAGRHTVWWDGLDDLARDTDAASHAVYHIPGRLVRPGRYRVRGLVRPEIGLTYEMTPYNEGSPAWRTGDPSSEWLGNHTPPAAALFIPEGDAPPRPAGKAPGGQILVGSYVSEGGSGIAWLDLDGRKLHGQLWIGGVWTGASHLARDEGRTRAGGVYAYTGAWWPGGQYNQHRSELRLYQLVSPDRKGKAPRDRRLGFGEDRAVLRPNFVFPDDPQWRANDKGGLSGLAVRDGLLVASLPMAGRLLFLDAAAHKVIGHTLMDDPRGLAFERSGALLVLSGRKLLRYTLPASTRRVDEKAPAATGKPIRLPKGQTVVSAGLDDPKQMTLDARGNIYVSDRGASHQVKVFTPGGKLLRAIGKPGKSALGPYDPECMNNPAGITIDSRSRLWVAEQDYTPKRLSIWTLDGKFVRALYGPPQYGGGGAIDPRDRTLFYYGGDAGGMAFKLDWDKAASRPVGIYVRTDTDPASLPYRGYVNMPPQTALYVGGRKYMTSSFNTHPTNGASIGMIWRMEDSVAVPAAALGRAADWPMLGASLRRHNQNFSVRWTGQVAPRYSETYTFATQTDDGVRLWVDGKRLIDNWTDHGTTEDKGTIALEAGKRYDIKMEYYQGTGGATARLFWQSRSQARQIIPADRLYPTKQAAKPGGLAAQYFGKKDLRDLKGTLTDPTVDFRWDAKGPAPLRPKQDSAFASRLPRDAKPGDPVLFLWWDRNDDARVQPKEVTFRKGGTGGITVMADLSFVAARVDDRAMRVAPLGFTAKGTPRYDLDRAETLAVGVQGPTSSGGDQALACEDGWTILTVAPKPFAPQGVGGVHKGKAKWSYPSLWPGLHASHIAPMPDRPGMMIGTTRLLGLPVRPRGPDAGWIWAINGNKGTIYLMTTDGLFVATLFRDCRAASWSMPKAVRGMSVARASLHEENFWPTISQTADGGIYLVAMNGSIVKVAGLEKVRRLDDADLVVTPKMLASARAYFVEAEARRQRGLRAKDKRELRVAVRRTAPKVDARLDDWAGAQWAPIDKRTGQVGDWGKVPLTTEAAVAVAADRLFLAFKVDDPNLLRNAGTSMRHLFKTGGALDVMIGCDAGADPKRRQPVAGDLRLLISRVKGKPVAVLYRPVAPGAKGEPVLFSSPLRTVRFDRVDDVTDHVVLAGAVVKNKQGNRDVGIFEASVPLSLLGLKPKAGQVIRADIGVLRGNGFRTLRRVYWCNKATGLTSDEPSEAELTPQLWGQWEFVAQ